MRRRIGVQRDHARSVSVNGGSQRSLPNVAPILITVLLLQVPGAQRQHWFFHRRHEFSCPLLFTLAKIVAHPTFHACRGFLSIISALCRISLTPASFIQSVPTALLRLVTTNTIDKLHAMCAGPTEASWNTVQYIRTRKYERHPRH